MSSDQTPGARLLSLLPASARAAWAAGDRKRLAAELAVLVTADPTPYAKLIAEALQGSPRQ